MAHDYPIPPFLHQECAKPCIHVAKRAPAHGGVGEQDVRVRAHGLGPAPRSLLQKQIAPAGQRHVIAMVSQRPRDDWRRRRDFGWRCAYRARVRRPVNPLRMWQGVSQLHTAKKPGGVAGGAPTARMRAACSGGANTARKHGNMCHICVCHFSVVEKSASSGAGITAALCEPGHSVAGSVSASHTHFMHPNSCQTFAMHPHGSRSQLQWAATTRQQ